MSIEKDPIDRLFEQANVLPRKKAPQGLLEKIQTQLKTTQVKTMPIGWFAGLAASFLVLVFLNIQQLKQSNQTQSNELEALAEELETTNTLY